MTAAADAARFLEERVAAVVREHGVPGVSAAVLAGGEIAAFGHGVLDVRTGVAVDVEERVPIASVSKVFTATAVVTLAEDGRVDLDRPLAEQVPLAEPVASGPAGRATPRQLLTHSSGIEGDFFLDPGDGDDAVARYLAACDGLRTVHPPGAAASYCNTGMVLLSGLVEGVLGCAWPEAVRRTVTGPAGVPGVLAVERFGGGKMVGHVGPADAREPAPPRPFPRAVSGAGGMWATPTEVLRLVAPHLGACGALAEMQRPQVEVPGPSWLLCPSAWGLGWSTYRWGGGRVIGHDGGGAGTSSFLRAVPEAGVAVALVANVGDCGPELGSAVAATVTELTGVRPPAPLTPAQVGPGAGFDTDPAVLAGWYAGSSEGWLVAVRDGRLELRTGSWDDRSSVDEDVEVLAPLDTSGRAWLAPATSAFRMASPVLFTDLPDGARMLHRFGRVAVAR